MRISVMVAVGVLMLSGCASVHQAWVAPKAGDQRLPQLVRFFSVSRVSLKGKTLTIAGKASAAADNGKATFSAKGPFSSYPVVRMTITSDDAAALSACLAQLQEMRKNHNTVDVRGVGTFFVQSLIDPPLETGLFTLTTLDACGATEQSTPSTPAPSNTPPVPAGSSSIIPPSIPAADLVAVPERFLDQPTVVTGRLQSTVHFSDSASSFAIESDGQTVPVYFVTTSLPADERLSIVHAAPGSLLVLQGTLTRVTPKSLAAQAGAPAAKGYEFDLSDILSVQPHAAQ